MDKTDDEVGSTDTDKADEKKARMDRKKAMGYIIAKLIENNPQLRISNVRYGDINAIFRGQNIKIKVGLSKNYKNPNDAYQKKHPASCASWNKEDDRHFSNYDYHIYAAVLDDMDYRALLFTTSEISGYVKKKTYNDHWVNYYFHWSPDGNTVRDVRESVPLDVSEFDVDRQSWVLK